MIFLSELLIGALISGERAPDQCGVLSPRLDTPLLRLVDCFRGGGGFRGAMLGFLLGHVDGFDKRSRDFEKKSNQKKSDPQPMQMRCLHPWAILAIL
jgi:hypothetical protein